MHVMTYCTAAYANGPSLVVKACIQALHACSDILPDRLCHWATIGLWKDACKALHACVNTLHNAGATSISTCLSLQVCIVLRMMAEEVTQYRDDLEADNKRQLLSALTACVPQVLPFLEQSMEGHFGQAVTAAQQGQHQMSQLHAAVVTAALGKPPRSPPPPPPPAPKFSSLHSITKSLHPLVSIIAPPRSPGPPLLPLPAPPFRSQP